MFNLKIDFAHSVKYELFHDDCGQGKDGRVSERDYWRVECGRNLRRMNHWNQIICRGGGSSAHLHFKSNEPNPSS